ncbi:membrane protein [Desulfosarcina widdelii]|uniref:Membrane protein n=1 Tax=Desulfosarcina widdelii TaxID=947919 RepID=A0A5K7ZES5_9BACT|nr:DUF364 domain-containing protein [Desulfosarcina widdelii]BBO78223.1 membrane protein [Desulfosarcina widdelii]
MNGKYKGCLKIDDLTYEQLKEKMAQIALENSLQEQTVNVVSARTLKPVESIGNPERKDFPLVKGREVMVEADFHGAKGQAFTDMPGEFQGTVGEILEMDLENNLERAVFIASLNAVLRHLQCLECTIHCKDEEPEECAQCLVDYVRKEFGSPKIAFIGLQPAMVDHLARNFNMRVTDMDPDNQGQTKYGIPIEPVDQTSDVIQWGDVVFATGSTLVNNTYRSLIQDRPLVFYGVTVSGIAYLTDCPQYCYNGH